VSVVLIVGADEDAAQRLGAATGHQVVALSVEAVGLETASLLRGVDPATLPDAVVFASDLPLPRSLAMAAEVHAARPDIEMVLIAASETQILLEAMRVGIRDLAPSLDDPTFLAGLRDRLDDRQRAMAPVSDITRQPVPVDFTSRTITVASPKGGVGKTSISSNLAVALAQQSPMEVVLVDLDLQFGDLSTVLDLHPVHTLADALGAGAKDNLLLKTYLTVHSAGFYVLCGADSPAANDRATVTQIQQLLKQLQGQFRYVIVDTAAGLDDAAVGALEVTDDLVIVSTMDVACLRNVRKALDLLSEIDLLPASRHLVVNFADRTSGMRIKDVETATGIPVDLVLPRTKDVPVATNKGVPIILGKKKSPFVKGVRQLGKRIFDRARAAEEKPGHRRLDVA
jgi:pilus assembly protein CpaE